MSAEYFMDTNVFVYAFSKNEPEKRVKAATLIHSALVSDRGVISTQVYQEFLHVALHKPSADVPPGMITDYCEHVLNPLCRVFPSTALFAKALDLHEDTQYRFYDCLVLAAAMESGAPVLYTEDLQHDRRFGDLRIVNPFL